MRTEQEAGVDCSEQEGEKRKVTQLAGYRAGVQHPTVGRSLAD